MRRSHRGASLLVVVLIVGALILVVSTIVIFNQTCNGTCASVPCSETAPCTINGTVYTAGSACAAGVLGTVCKDNWWPFEDCLCANVIGQGGIPKSLCVK